MESGSRDVMQHLEPWRKKDTREAFWRLRIFLNQVLKAVVVDKPSCWDVDSYGTWRCSFCQVSRSRKMGGLATVNAQQNRKKDVVSISLCRWLCHGFSAPHFSQPIPQPSSSLLPVPPVKSRKPKAHYLSHSPGFICSASPQGSGSNRVCSFNSLLNPLIFSHSLLTVFES